MTQRIGWLLVGALALTGYALIIAPGQRRLSSVEVHAHELYDLANRNEQMLRDLQELKAARARVERDVRSLAGQNSAGKATLATLRLLQREAQAHHVIVSGLTPDSDAPAESGGTQDASITLHGAYRDIVAAVADMSRHDVLIEVGEVELVGAGGFATAAAVDATVHATLYHDIAAVMKERGNDVRQAAVQ